MRDFACGRTIKQVLDPGGHPYTRHFDKGTVLGGILGCFEPGFEPEQYSHPGEFSWLIVAARIINFCANRAIRTMASDHCGHRAGACRRHVDSSE